MVKIISESHTDHALGYKISEFALAAMAEVNEFCIREIVIPEEVGTVLCQLRGPAVGELAIPESDVYYAQRSADRTWQSRMVAKDPIAFNVVTVIVGPHGDEPCVLYTMYGGPQAPQEPGDPACKDVEASKRFWTEHALAGGVRKDGPRGWTYGCVAAP